MKKTLLKLSAILISMLMLLALAACGGDTKAPAASDSGSQTGEATGNTDKADTSTENKDEDTVSEKIEYEITDLVDETVKDDKYNRELKLPLVRTNSKHVSEINKTITSWFGDIYVDYLLGNPLEDWKLVVDYTYAEVDGVLCICLVANTPSTYVAPLKTEFIYLDLNEDKLYSPKEYLAEIGVNAGELTQACQNEITNCAGLEYLGMYYENGEKMALFDVTHDDGGEILVTHYVVMYGIDRKKLNGSGLVGFEGFPIEWRAETAE